MCGLVILYDGYLVYECYVDGFLVDIFLLGWLMIKSVINVLVGLMVKNGKLLLDQDKLFFEWVNDECVSIILVDFLYMNSGLEWNEVYGGVLDVIQMLYCQLSMVDYVVVKLQVSELNINWVYFFGIINFLSQLVCNVFNDEVVYVIFVCDSLFLFVGMYLVCIEVD